MMRRLLGSFRQTWLTAIAITVLAGCGSSTDSNFADPNSAASLRVQAQAVHFCGGCHAWPQPHTFTQDQWEAEIRQGYRFYGQSGRSDLTVPDVDEIIKWYVSRAPESLPLTDPGQVSQTLPVNFQQMPFSPDLEKMSYGVADLAFIKNDLIVGDMKTGMLARLQFDGHSIDAGPITRLRHPAHIEFCDIDRDGLGEFLVADLGSYAPSDHSEGHVVLITPPRNESDSIRIEPVLSNVGRVADCRCADFTGDGLPDILVAEFGWRKTGSIHLLTQTAVNGRRPTFEQHTIDRRHGASHIPLVDLDNDGDIDFVALISQEHETIVAFLNQGDGRFEQVPILIGDDPDFGSSCIWLADIDGDNDTDVVYSNGDSMDSGILKPSHGVHWIENLGNLEFRHHSISKLPGAMGVAAADFDQDGDQDIVACAMTWNRDTDFANLVLFDQHEPGKFKRHNLEVSRAQHAVIEVGDFDRDGDPDLAVGEFEERTTPSESLLSIWWNHGPR